MTAGPFWHSRDPQQAASLDPQWSQTFFHVWNDVKYKDGYGIGLYKDKTDPKGRWYFQVECERPDAVTGEISVGRGGKAYLSPHMNQSELVRLVFGLFIRYEEHETREFFQWRGRSVFGPHIDIESLWVAAEDLDYRT